MDWTHIEARALAAPKYLDKGTKSGRFSSEHPPFHELPRKGRDMTFDEMREAVLKTDGVGYRKSWVGNKSPLLYWNNSVQLGVPFERVYVKPVAGALAVVNKHQNTYIGNKGVLSMDDLAADDWDYIPF